MKILVQITTFFLIFLYSYWIGNGLKCLTLLYAIIIDCSDLSVTLIYAISMLEEIIQRNKNKCTEENNSINMLSLSIVFSIYSCHR